MKDDPEFSFSKLERAPAYKIVSDAIMNEIIGGRLGEGRHLPSEQRLAAQFGVNRSTVREGIRLLEETGVVRRDVGKRLVVRRPSYGEVGGRVGQAFVLHDVTFGEILETLTTLEINCAGIAARKRNAEDIRKIEANLQRARNASDDLDEMAELDLEFHDILLDAARNRALSLTARPLIQILAPTYRAIYANVPAAGDRMLTAHGAIADAIIASDAETARRWMERHLADFQRGYELAGFDIHLPARMPKRV